jgi:hypothetical protein
VMATGAFLGSREFGRRYMEEELSGGAIINLSTLNYLITSQGMAAIAQRRPRSRTSPRPLRSSTPRWASASTRSARG